MAIIQAETLADVLYAILPDLRKDKSTMLVQDLQDHVWFNRILKNGVSGTGRGVTIRLTYQDDGNFTNEGLFAPSTTNTRNKTIEGFVPWRHSHTSFPTEERLVAMSSGSEEVYDLVKKDMAACLIEAAEQTETIGWSKPTSSTDTTTPWGVQMFLVRNATEGFTGADPSGFTSGYGGIAVADVPGSRWYNRSAQATNYERDDYYLKLKNHILLSKFKAPKKYGTDEAEYRQVIYCDIRTFQELKMSVEDQNDMLGVDLDSMQGRVTVDGIPTVWVPALDADTGYPTYGITWGENKTEVRYLKGFKMRELVRKSPLQPMTTETHYYMSWNPVCHDRRANWLIYF